MKSIIKEYNTCKTQLKLTEICNINNIDNWCEDCGFAIWYPHTKLRLTNNILTLVNASRFTTKRIDDLDYFLSICYSCLIKKYNEFTEKHSSKLFNTYSYWTCYAFKIPEDKLKTRNNKNSVTLENLIRKYGESIGSSKYQVYVNKQSDKNKFENKRLKYNWSSDEFVEFNKSRAVTLENLVNKYGDELGIVKWSSYLEKQSYTKSLIYLQTKYGIDEGLIKHLEINKKKALTIDNYIRLYGAELGLIKFTEFISTKRSHHSQSSQKLFRLLDSHLKDSYTTYFASKNKEFGKLLSNNT